MDASESCAAECEMLSAMHGDAIAKRAKSFEKGAGDYERLRPAFPGELFDDIRAAAGARLKRRVLKVDAGTGRATLPLVRAGVTLDVVEPSADMLTVLAARLSADRSADRCRLRQTTFEDVDPLETYDVVVAAQSFHWADPATRWSRLSSLIRDDGTAFMFWNHWHLDPNEHDTAAVRALYEEHGGDLEPDLDDHRPPNSWFESRY